MTTTLSEAIEAGPVAHVILFADLRGTGKTPYRTPHQERVFLFAFAATLFGTLAWWMP